MVGVTGYAVINPNNSNSCGGVAGPKPQEECVLGNSQEPKSQPVTPRPAIRCPKPSPKKSDAYEKP